MATPRLFVIHDYHDDVWCRAFVAALRGLGTDVWCDDFSLPRGDDDWLEVIGRELAAREEVVLILSSLGWQGREVQVMYHLAEMKSRHILPVITRLDPEVNDLVLTHRWTPISGLTPEAAAVTLARALGGGTAAPLPRSPTVVSDPPAPAVLAPPPVMAPAVPYIKESPHSPPPVVIPPPAAPPAPPSPPIRGRREWPHPPPPAAPRAYRPVAAPPAPPLAKKQGITRRELLAAGLTGATVAAVGGGLYWFSRSHSDQTLATTPTNTPTLPPTLPPTPVTDNSYVPTSLQTLGFVGKVYGNVKVIIPPVVSVPAGPFLMGSDPAKDPQANSDEQPQSTITIAPAYQIGQYHVTVAEYALAVQAGAVPQPPDTTGTYGITWQAQLNTPDHPVVNVTWLDVVKYVQWLARVTGDGWRLPTEAEWEKAARGTDGRIYPWGNTFDAAKANTSEGGKNTTTAVGAYAGAGDASPYGAHDMAGNAWQWMSTIYDQTKYPYPYNLADGRENMSDSTSFRVLRGGAWDLGSNLARAAFRPGVPPTNVGSNVGARLLLTAEAGS